MSKKLTEYKNKRDFTKTSEPKGTVKERKSGKPIFVIQQHHARQMHYDFRLEIDGVLKSWAVPKGPSTNPKVKRLAALTEDHPLDYATFEGIIPEGYGAGSVIVWDTGTYDNLTEKDGKALSMTQAFKNNHIKINLHGKKLQGAYALTHFKDNDWLLVKVKDEYADAKADVVATEPRSVLSKKTIVSFSHPDKIYFPQTQITKGEVIAYYQKVAPFLLPYVKNRPLVMHRFPEGIAHEGFYHKQVPDYFPTWIDRKTVRLKNGEKQTLVMVNSSDSLAYLANQGVLVFHGMLSCANAINKPDRIVFDLDPSDGDMKDLRFAARAIKKKLEHCGLHPFLMTTGSRGFHVVTPIVPEHSFDKVHAFARKIADDLAREYPKRLTTEVSKASRKGRVFIDYLRNSYGQTSVVPYSVRAHEGASVATPIAWAELSKTKPQQYTIKTIFKRLARKKDVWKDFFKKAEQLVIK